MKMLIPSELEAFKSALRMKLTVLRDENERQQPERYDLDITPACQGFEAALDAVEDAINELEKNPPR